MMKEIDDIRNDWWLRGFNCHEWRDAPGYVWRDYIHKVDELLLLIAGDIEVTIGNKVHQLKPYDEIFIPANTLHTVKNSGLVSNRWLYGYREVDSNVEF